MGLGLIAAGLLFIFNPNINIFDIFPDFLGAVLIYFGLVKMSRLNLDIKQAKKLFGIFFWVELAKFISIAFISSQDSTRFLLFSFLFGVIECIVFTYSTLSLFNGIEALGRKADSDVVFSAKKRGKKLFDLVSTAKTTMLTFFYVRTAAAILPEFTEIGPEQIYYGNRLVDVDFTKFKPLFHGLFFVVVSIFSIFYLTRGVAFFIKLTKDEKLNKYIKSEHSAFLESNPDYYATRRMGACITLYAIAVLLTFNPSGDGLPWMPLAFIVPFIIASAILIGREHKLSLLAIIPSVALLPISVNGTNLEKAFYDDSTKFTDIFYIESSMKKFNAVSNSSLLQYVLLGIALIIITYGILKSKKLIISSVCCERETNSDKVAEITETYGVLSKRLKIFAFVTSIYYCLMTKLVILLGALSALTPAETFDYARVIAQGLSAVNMLLPILWFVTAVKLLKFLKGKDGSLFSLAIYHYKTNDR